MIRIRRSEDRGQADHGWLLAKHSFSFADYQDKKHMGFRGLRVINEDQVQPGQGFGTHGHRDMEILTYVLEGAVEHRDNIGNHGQIVPGEVQVMSAGKGILHSEFNPSKNDVLHLLQIWMLPNEPSVAPRYDDARIQADLDAGGLIYIAGPMGDGAKVQIHSDTKVYAARLAAGAELSHELPAGRAAWVQVARGEVTLNGEALQQGDGAATDDVSELTFTSPGGGEILVFELA